MPKAPKKPATPDLSTAEGAYAFFLDAAQALDAREVLTPRADATLIGHNFRAAATAVDAIWSEVTATFVAPDRSIVTSATALTLALSKADREAFDPLSDGALSKKMARVYELRTQLFAAAELGKTFRLIDAATLQRIRSGRGPIDAARDLADLSPLFTPAVLAKIPMVTEALLLEAKTLSAEVLVALTPTAAKTDPARRRDEANKTARDLRNRFFTLVSQRHETLWRYGAGVWGRAVEEHIGALGSQKRSATEAANAPT